MAVDIPRVREEKREQKQKEKRGQEIRQLCTLLQGVWLDHPSLRMPQLMVNVSPTNDPYYVTDTEISNSLFEFWKKFPSESE